MNSRSEILDKVKEAICTDRNVRYGEPEDIFGTIAILWEAYLERRGILDPGGMVSIHTI